VVLQAADARLEPARFGLHLALLGRLFRRRRWLAGAALGILAFPLQVVAYANAPISAVQPALAGGLVLVLFLGSRYMGERVRAEHYAGALAIVAGIALVTAAGPAHREPSRGDIVQLSVMALLAVGVVAPYLARGRVRLPAIALTTSAGLAFAWGDLATKLFGDAMNGDRFAASGLWLAAVAASAVIATLTLMTAFQRAAVRRVVPVSFGVEAMVPIVLAPVLLLHAGGFTAADVPLVVLGLAVMIAGVAIVAGSDQVSWAMAPGGRFSYRAARRRRTQSARALTGARSTRTPPASEPRASLPPGGAIAWPARRRTRSRR
jgi:drug/metabolite transporter (DMT)-like permease